MAKVLTFPRNYSFERKFEELPLFSEKEPKGEWFFTALIDGTMEVSFDSTGEWWISSIRIEVENFKRTKDGGRSKLIELNGDDHPGFFWLILDVLADKYANTIADWVAFELAEAA